MLIISNNSLKNNLINSIGGVSGILVCLGAVAKPGAVSTVSAVSGGVQSGAGPGRVEADGRGESGGGN